MKLLSVFLTVLLSCSFVYATPPLPPDCNKSHEQCGHDDSDESSPPSSAQADSTALSESKSKSTAHISIRDVRSISEGTGGESTATITYAQQVPNIYLGSPGNAADCNLIIGFSGARKDGATAFGIPWPRGWAPTCDIWKAAEEAQQNGHIFTSYALQCTIKHLAKRYGKKSCDAFKKKSLIELGIVKESVGDTVTIPITRYNQIMLAQVQQEELDEARGEIKSIRKELDNVTERLEKQPSPAPVRSAPDPELKAMKEREEKEKARARAYFRAKYDASIAQAEEQTDEVPEDN